MKSPCLLAPQDLDVEKSMGAILSATHVTPPLVEHNMMTLKNNPHLSIIGMLKGENEYTYASYTRVQAEEMLDCLQEIAPFVIVDCSSYIGNDVLSAVSLMDCDSVIRLVNCDLKSISYLSSQLPLLQNSGFQIEKQYKVAGNVKPNQVTKANALVFWVNYLFKSPILRKSKNNTFQVRFYRNYPRKAAVGDLQKL